MKTKHLLLALISLCLASCEKFEEMQEERLDASKAQTLYQIKYGSNNRHVLDIALPKDRNENTPVVIFIHGGAWIMGDKSVFAMEIQQFANEGIACATINYRYASGITNVHHPDLPNDVNMAIDFIASKADKWNISNSRFGIVGHSAGGHLALSSAYSRTDNKVKACASWAGLINLIDHDQLAITGSDLLFQTYLGVPLKSSADTLKYKHASPFWNVNSYSVPTLLVHGTKDIGVPYSNAVRMHGKLNDLLVQNSLITFDGAGHIWTGKSLTRARESTLAWFQATL